MPIIQIIRAWVAANPKKSAAAGVLALAGASYGGYRALSGGSASASHGTSLVRSSSGSADAVGAPASVGSPLGSVYGTPGVAPFVSLPANSVHCAGPYGQPMDVSNPAVGPGGNGFVYGAKVRPGEPYVCRVTTAGTKIQGPVLRTMDLSGNPVDYTVQLAGDGSSVAFSVPPSGGSLELLVAAGDATHSSRLDFLSLERVAVKPVDANVRVLGSFKPTDGLNLYHMGTGGPQ